MSDSGSWPQPDPAQWQAPGWPPPRHEDLRMPVDPGPLGSLPVDSRTAALAYAPPAANPVRSGWDGVFFRFHASWLLLFGFVGIVAMVAAAFILFGSGAEAGSDIGFAALLYVPLLAWVGFLMWRTKLRLQPFFAVPHIGKYWWTVLGMTVVLLIFSIGASSLTSLLLPWLTEGAGISTEGNPLLLFIALAVLPPVVEELVFRGVLLERWAVKWRVGVAVVVQAICFGVLHADPVGAGIFGACMALMYLRTRTLLVPMAMHALNNGTVFVVLMLGGGQSDEQPSPVEALVTGVVMLAIATPFVVLFIRRNWPGVDRLTPYEAFEYGVLAMPPRRLGRVGVVGAPPASYRWFLGPTDLVVSRNRRGGDVAWCLPYRGVTHFGATQDFGTVSVTLSDGSVLTLQPGSRSPRTRKRCAAALQQRVPQAPVRLLQQPA